MGGGITNEMLGGDFLSLLDVHMVAEWYGCAVTECEAGGLTTGEQFTSWRSKFGGLNGGTFYAMAIEV